MTLAAQIRRLSKDCRGVAAIEFALLLPLLVLLYLGGYAVARSVAISRKVTITTRALADLTSQFVTMSSSDMTTVINASAQIIAPFPTEPLSIRLSEITTDATGTAATVTWSTGLNQTPYSANQKFALPTGMNSPNTSYIFSEVGYQYKPIYGDVGPFNITDKLYMRPRLSPNVNYSGS
ncbi:TadE/TadG family type IV pilus assembly protein [Hyphomicrobium sp. 2TAF46]|uniref:TadE/TadG family type IV pilus assembly protein n=1 Tax=Hyphomicrobium sp. 2TAF46 TaxID=3233019 RepID=UPI003F917B9C